MDEDAWKDSRPLGRVVAWVDYGQTLAVPGVPRFMFVGAS